MISGIPVPCFNNIDTDEENPHPAKSRKVEGHPFDSLETEAIQSFMQTSSNTHIIAFETLFLEKNAYPLIECGEGEFHKVFSFREVQKLTFQGKELSTSDIVIKTYKPEANKNKVMRTIHDDMEAYALLSKHDITVPFCHANPKTFQLAKDPIWILERMVAPITGDSWAQGETYDSLEKTDKRVLEFAKKYLTENARGIANKTGEFIGDFNPKNVMLDGQNRPVVIDPTLPETDKWNCRDNLKKNVKHWSRGNPYIIEYLIKDFPESTKALFDIHNI